jgi:hypothetical protein
MLFGVKRPALFRAERNRPDVEEFGASAPSPVRFIWRQSHASRGIAHFVKIDVESCGLSGGEGGI